MKTLAHSIAIAGAALVATPLAMGTYIDAVGDAQDTFGLGDPLLDIDAVHVLYSDTTLFVEMTFHTPISAPSLGLADGVVGLLEFDIDQDVSTGGAPVQNVFSPPFAFLEAGIDMFLALGSELDTPGFMALVDGMTFETILLVPVVYGPMGFSTEIPLAALGDDGVLDFTTTIGTLPQPTDATDFVATSTAVPTPGVLALLGMAAVRRRRRR